jgi:Zn-dependent M28 family amino/carboxypeptidase
MLLLLIFLKAFTIMTDSAVTRLKKDVEFLCNVQPPRSYNNPQGQAKVIRHIQQSFNESLGNSELQTFKADGKDYQNVIARYNPGKSQKMVVGAHFDVAGELPGADDNASGVAGLLELARMIGEKKPALDYTIEFVAFNLEEPPFFASDEMGSAYHARMLYKNKEQITLMLCLEMIGYYTEKQEYPSPEFYKIFPSNGNFIAVVGKAGQEATVEECHKLMKQGCGIPVEKIAADERLPIAFFSDHRNYLKYGYPSVMIDNTSFLRNKNYHTRNDTPDTLDYDKMWEVVKGCYEVMVGW